MSRDRGPGRDAARSSGSTAGASQLKAGFVLLVGLSGGLVALQSDAALPVVGAAILGGLVAGGALLWYLLRITT
ncbi:hypothetical protein [Natrinema altunense]|uniref:Uncharacterized protein n=1 Tax=Natrinema altunense (strain JCM 12890 / CGMCC 1.3731 / AJ2) TaxID=1227494 RepID=L9ZKB1_NATA2|nr:hypothetical protein [Natrinema altunense]ELY86794.1 hypothetical protein C485_07747 [Natrinema altunense JCM 12890]